MRVLRYLAIGVAMGVLAIGALLVVAAMASMTVDAWGEAYVVDEPLDLPKTDAVLVLGSSFFGKRGQTFRTMSWRMDTAAGLWHAGVADRFLLSGNRIDDSYDETVDMRNELAARGVPVEVMELDPYGLRTWDSVVRAKLVFGKRRLVIVSQRDHLARALFLARHIGIDAWGAPARGGNYFGLRNTILRHLTCLVAYMDVVIGPTRAVISAGSPR